MQVGDTNRIVRTWRNNLGASTTSDTIEHLKIIQGVISRMAQTSFILKGWMITIVVAVLGLSVAATNHSFGLLSLFPVLVFWGLDAYYLRQERLFRGLYELVRQDSEHATVPPFSMSTDPCRRAVPSWWATVLSPAEWPMYLSTIVLVLVVSFVHW